jgi:hypothetical protein
MNFRTLTQLSLISAALGFQSPLPATKHCTQTNNAPKHQISAHSQIGSSLNLIQNRADQNVNARSFGLHQSSTDGDGEIASSSTPDLLSNIASHRTASILYAITTVIHLAKEGVGVGGEMMAGASAAIKIQQGQFSATKVGGVLGFAIAAFVSRTLYKEKQKEGDAKDGDFCLDTRSYRKLNFGLLAFAFFGLFAVPGEASLSNTSTGTIGTSVLAFVVQYVSRVIGLGAAFKGWTASNDLKFKKQTLFQEFSKGVSQTWKNDEPTVHEVSGKKKKNSIYSTIFVFTVLGMMNNAMTFQHVTKKTAVSLFHKSMYLSAIARLSLISSLAAALHNATLGNIAHNEVFKKFKLLLAGWIITVGAARGVIDTGLVSLVLQKTVYLCVFAWPMMYQGSSGNQDNENGTDSLENA